MKKTFSIAVILLSVLALCFASDDDKEVNVDDNVTTETATIDNLVVNMEVDIEDFAIFKPTEFGFFDTLGYYNKGARNIEEHGWHFAGGYFYSGNEADYAILRIDMTNTALEAKDFLKNCSVKVVFNDKYEYDGWFYQSNYDNYGYSGDYYRLEEDNGKQHMRYAINSEDQFAINPMYVGHYIFGCTLPNTVVESTKPLKMIITVDGNELTYNIRKQLSVNCLRFDGEGNLTFFRE